MEALDLKTLMFVLLILNTFGFLAYMYSRFSILRMPGIGVWAAGHLVFSVFYFCILLNMASPHPTLKLLIVGSLVATHALWWAGARLFFNRKSIHLLLCSLPAIMVVLAIVCAKISFARGWTEQGQLFGSVYVLLFLTCAFYQLAIAREFIRYHSPRLMNSVVVGYAFALIAVLSLLKALSVPDSLPVLFVSSSGYSISTFIIAIFIQVFSMFGLILIAAERLQVRLNRLAQSDPLTGLLNRRGFELLSKQQMKRSKPGKKSGKKSGKKQSAMMAFDLDHFKQVNDTYGHATGDEVLTEFAKCLTDNTRAADVVARFGGEEFVVLCFDVDQGDAINTAQRICDFMAAHIMQSRGGEDFTITVSVGLVMIEEKKPDLSRYIDTADTALYDAKAGGRNKVVMAEHLSCGNAPLTSHLSNTALVAHTEQASAVTPE
jgi:diguanylate cyclase (GGDEF)-like protein